MDLGNSSRIVVPLATGSFVLVGFLWPLLRMRVRYGARGLVVHEGGLQRVIGVGMGAVMLAALLWSALCATIDHDLLGIWRVPRAMTWLGWILMSSGFALVAIAQAQMGASWRIGVDARPTALVTHGLFRVVRNPIFSAMFVALLGLTLTTPSPWTVMALPNYALLVTLQVRLEERHLETLHGEPYRSYAGRVGRFLPFVGRSL